MPKSDNTIHCENPECPQASRSWKSLLALRIHISHSNTCTSWYQHDKTSARRRQENVQSNSVPSVQDPSTVTPAGSQPGPGSEMDLPAETGSDENSCQPAQHQRLPTSLPNSPSTRTGANSSIPQARPVKSSSGQWESKDSTGGWTFPNPSWEWMDEEDLVRRSKWEEIWAQVQSREGQNRFYPFSDSQEWDVAAWLIKSGLTKTKIDAFLNLKYVRANLHG